MGTARRRLRTFGGNSRKKALTEIILLHICLLTGGARLRALPRLRLLMIGNPVAPDEGEETCRLFDIVGFDEGTCGRRPRSATASGCRSIG